MLIQSKYRPQKGTPEKPRSHLLIVYTEETQDDRPSRKERISVPIEGAIEERTAFDIARGICGSIVDGSIDVTDNDALNALRQALLAGALLKPPLAGSLAGSAAASREDGAAAEAAEQTTEGTASASAATGRADGAAAEAPELPEARCPRSTCVQAGGEESYM
jgi:hypothetical protein